jgi:hypothetical protein
MKTPSKIKVKSYAAKQPTYGTFMIFIFTKVAGSL